MRAPTPYQTIWLSGPCKSGCRSVKQRVLRVPVIVMSPGVEVRKDMSLGEDGQYRVAHGVARLHDELQARGLVLPA